MNNEVTIIGIVNSIIVTIATVVLAWLTSRYVRSTKLMLDEMKSSHDPSVFVDLEFPDRRARLSIGNTGQSPAINIRFTIQDDVPWHKAGINTLPVMQNGITYLPPGRTLRFMLATLDWEKIDEQKGVVRIGITYESEFGKKFERESVIYLSQYKGVLFDVFRDPISEITAAIREATQVLRSQHSSEARFKAMERPMKTCSFCGEDIPEVAKKCSRCREFISDSSDS